MGDDHSSIVGESIASRGPACEQVAVGNGVFKCGEATLRFEERGGWRARERGEGGDIGACLIGAIVRQGLTELLTGFGPDDGAAEGHGGLWHR